ncbi:MAG: cytochrome c3 family protein [Acidobacteriota bacterium]|nr:cytochrome c3 family protein [Acidobacteriota bacterium]
MPPNIEFVGDRLWALYHQKQVALYSQSPMGMAMESVVDSRVLGANPVLTFRHGPYSYLIKRKVKQSFYTVSDGKESLTVPILYAFGQGKAGQTYVLQYQGELYESRVSFYKEIAGLDFTVGTANNIPASLKEALGRRLSEDETKDCFGCHSSKSMNGGKINLEKVIPGIRCETCHGPGARHVAAIQSGEPGGKLIFNPRRLSSDQLSQEFCSACHRSTGDFEKMRSLQINNVRFQPYRIFYSKCYSDDRRIGCTACHNPHEPVKEDITYYDAKCLACHARLSKTRATAMPSTQGLALSCKVGTKDCVSCHMQKIGPPQTHFKFTDHYIRIVKSRAAYPN